MQSELQPLDFGIPASQMAPLELRAKILELEAIMMKMTGDQIDIDPVHRFAKGMYSREITIPQGTTLVGRLHKKQHICVVSQGDVSVLAEDGVRRVRAPATFISSPGTKRVIHAHEDTVWTTFHATDETDLGKLEAELIAKSYQELEATPPPLMLEEK